MQNKGQYANVSANRLYHLQSVLFIMAYTLVYSDLFPDYSPLA